jgi:chromate transporter
LGSFYLRYGALPAIEPFFLGIKPAVLSVIAIALWRMGAKAVRGRLLAGIGLLALVANLLGANEIVSLLGAGALGAFLLGIKTPSSAPPSAPPPPSGKKSLGLALPLAPLAGWPLASATGGPINLWELGLFFFKVGALLYGSGYVLIAFLQGGLVEQFGWMTQPQLLDAIAVGQFTPGPLSSTSTFIGYLLAGVPGAALATLGMFLPSFLIVVLIGPFVPRLRRSAWMSRFLDAVAVSSLGLMAAVAIKLGISVLISWQAVLIALVAAGVAWRFKVNSAWLVLGGSLLGWLLSRIA